MTIFVICHLLKIYISKIYIFLDADTNLRGFIYKGTLSKLQKPAKSNHTN